MMLNTKDLTKFSAEQMQEFFKSFDVVMSDIDGVLSQISTPIKGGYESLAALQKLGKKVYLVTNNSTNTAEYYCKSAKHACLNLTPDHIITPLNVIVWYLKKINFRDEAYAIVSEQFRKVLKEAGIRLVETPKFKKEDPHGTIQEILDRPSVKAVIVDFDADCNWMKLALAISCLERKDVLYIVGALDEWLVIQGSPRKVKILGPGPLINIITAQSGREPMFCGKPSQALKDYILEKCNVTDPRRCLFIGDTLTHDMKFASLCGFIKLLVGTGHNTMEHIQKDDDSCPDYYIPAINQLFSVGTDSQIQCLPPEVDID